MRDIKFIVVHHSGGPRSQTVEQIRKYHTDPPPHGRGWSKIGYPFLITEDGRLHFGHDWREPGINVGGMNSVCLGICVIGDNTKGAEAWNEKQVDALVTFLDTMSAMFPDAQIVGHKTLRPTACPGRQVQEYYTPV